VQLVAQRLSERAPRLAFAAEYTAAPPTPTLPAIDPVSTTWPPRRSGICGSSSRTSSIAETRSTINSSSTWPGGIAVNGPAQPASAQASSYLELMELFSQPHASIHMIVQVCSGIWQAPHIEP
jgi:hypothetical protein